MFIYFDMSVCISTTLTILSLEGGKLVNSCCWIECLVVFILTQCALSSNLTLS